MYCVQLQLQLTKVCYIEIGRFYHKFMFCRSTITSYPRQEGFQRNPHWYSLFIYCYFQFESSQMTQQCRKRRPLRPWWLRRCWQQRHLQPMRWKKSTYFYFYPKVGPVTGTKGIKGWDAVLYRICIFNQCIPLQVRLNRSLIKNQLKIERLDRRIYYLHPIFALDCKIFEIFDWQWLAVIQGRRVVL